MEMEPVFKKVMQIGLVVKSVAEGVKKYQECGIGPWEIKELGPDKLGNLTVRGERLDFALLAAVAMIGDTQIELIEPLDDKSIYSEFLQQHGEGLHHLAMDIDGFQKTISFFENKGVGVLQSGTMLQAGTVLQAGAGFAYLDSEKQLSFIAEIYDRP